MPHTHRTPIDRRLLIEGLGKGLRVIEAFSEEHARLTATEAGARAGLTRTAARRYLMSLVHFGYADTDGKHYWLLPRVLRLGQSYLEASRLPRLVQPFLQQLSMRTGETANFSALDGHEVVYLVRSHSPRVLSIGFHPGARMPAHVVSTGYAILSAAPNDVLQDWIEAHDFVRFTPHTVTDPAEFRDRVAAARRQGYCAADQLIHLGLGGLAVPLMARQGGCLGALSMTFPCEAYPEDRHLRELLPPLLDTARSLRDIA